MPYNTVGTIYIICDKCHAHQVWTGDMYCQFCLKRLNSFSVADQLKLYKDKEILEQFKVKK